jgi:DNA-binding FadR family transcriptional regulator
MRAKTEAKRPAAASAVERVANELRDLALDSDEGAYLGSEESLGAQLGVSAPTLRQAARWLEYEQVLEVKRGVLGGYFARRPRIDVITPVAANYLRANRRALDDLIVLMQALNPILVDLVIGCQLEGAFDALQGFATPAKRDLPAEEFYADERRFITLLTEMTGNAPLRLILAIFHSYAALLPKPSATYDKKLARSIHDARAAMAGAFVARDAKAALTHLIEHQELGVQLARRNLSAVGEKSPGGLASLSTVA